MGVVYYQHTKGTHMPPLGTCVFYFGTQSILGQLGQYFGASKYVSRAMI